MVVLVQFVARPADRDWDRTLETDIETSVYSLPLKASESEAQLADSCLAFIGFVWPELLAGFIAPRSRRRWQSLETGRTTGLQTEILMSVSTVRSQSWSHRHRTFRLRIRGPIYKISYDNLTIILP